ncbi:MAG: hypothetical protein O3A63_20550 [Proteobacteria bacterium]|nr:hypothetical protein [Pseudomonadota bacterium]
MIHMTLLFTGLLSLVLTVHAQESSPVPRTAWGAPDFEGNWDFRSITPFERPEYFKDKEFLTEEEVAGFEKAVNDGRITREASTEFQQGQGDVDVGYNSFFLDLGDKMTGTMRSSLVTDPPNGRLPELSANSRSRMGEKIKLWARAPQGPEDRNQFDRCLMGFNFGPPITPGAYNNMMQIVQTEDHVAMLVEMVNDHRIIPTGARDPLPANMRLWKGDSRGEWQSDTFVVTTTNLNDHYMFRGGTGNTTLTERLTLKDANTLEYRFTVDDPLSWPVPWSAVMDLVRTDDDVFEYACHEGNYAMPLMLKGARKQDREGTEDDTWLPSWSKPRS